MTASQRSWFPDDAAAPLPDTLDELKRELEAARRRIVRHRDTIDMRLARRIEDRIDGLQRGEIARRKP